MEVDVPDRSKYETHRERRLAERKSRFEDDEKRLEKNILCRTYYWERREEVLAQKAAKWAALTDEEKEDSRAYQRAYYLKYKEEYKLRGKLDRATKASENPDPKKVGRPRGSVSTKIKKSKTPKQYFKYDSTIPLPESNTLQYRKTRYGQKKLNAHCPLGFYQAPESSTPWTVEF